MLVGGHQTPPSYVLDSKQIKDFKNSVKYQLRKVLDGDFGVGFIEASLLNTGVLSNVRSKFK